MLFGIIRNVGLKRRAIPSVKYKLQCVACGDTDKKLTQKNGVHLCTDCIKDFFKEVAFEEVRR